MISTNIHCYPMKSGIRSAPEFAKKKLAKFKVNVGLKCAHGCTYCSSGASLRCHEAFGKLGESPFEFGYAIVDPDMPDKVAHDAARKRKRGVVQLCTTVDAWCPAAQKHDLGKRCLKALLSEPGWTVRILTKNAAVADDFDLIEQHKDRVLFGMSLTGDNADILSVVEPNASPLPERMKTMQRAHDLGFRTYGMLCPLMPGIADDPKQIDELVRFVKACGAEEVFAEAVNPRGPGLELTQKALEEADYQTEASAIERIRQEVNWSPYSADLVANVQEAMRKHEMIDKLRLLLYPLDLTDEDKKRVREDDQGVIWLGKSKLTKESRKIVKKIQRLQRKEHKPKSGLLRVKVEIGDALIDLKRDIKPGLWTIALRNVGYNSRTAQRLMRLSGSWLGEEIRNKDSVLAKRLPVDLQKLEMLLPMSPEQFERISGDWPRLEQMSRSKLRDAANALLQPGQPDGEAQETARIESTQAADSPSAVSTLCQAASDLKSNAEDLDPKEMDAAIDTLQDVLTFLKKKRKS